MTRLKISIVIIMLIVGISIFSGKWINGRCGELVGITDTAEEFFLNGETERAAEAAARLDAEWKKFRKGAAIFVHNNKLVELDRLCTRVKLLAENQSDDFIIELEELKQMFSSEFGTKTSN